MFLTHDVDQQTVANANNCIQMQLEVIYPSYYAAVLCELWHLRIILLLEVSQCIPLDVEVSQCLPMYVSWRDVPPNLVIESRRFRSNRDALPGLQQYAVRIHSDELVVH